jgi:hypothetical protein
MGQEKNYAAMVTRLDSDVGELADLLKELGIEKKQAAIEQAGVRAPMETVQPSTILWEAMAGVLLAGQSKIDTTAIPDDVHARQI